MQEVLYPAVHIVRNSVRLIVTMQGPVIYLILRLRGGGGGPLTEDQIQMGVAAGGFIEQSIIRDPFPVDLWDRSRTVVFNVRILNAATFGGITGLPPPPTPITAKTYAEHGFPYFKLYNEKASGIKGNFTGVKSVNQLDKSGKRTTPKKRGIDEVENSYTNPVIVLDPDGTHRPFRAISELEEELKAMRVSRSATNQTGSVVPAIMHYQRCYGRETVDGRCQARS